MTQPLIIPKSDSPKMFDAIAKRYDLLNRLLSLGQDVAWRKRLVYLLPKGEHLKLLDLASGTADVLITLAEHDQRIVSGVGIDPAAKMLAVGQAKIKAKNLQDRLTLQVGDAQALPFLDESFDCVTISFGIRNVPDLRLGLLEMYRVTKKSGRVLILEFSKPANPILACGHYCYLSVIVPLVGFIFSGNFKAYQYLNQTVQSFPYGDRFCKILAQFGFVNINAYPLMGGVATIYCAQKSVIASEAKRSNLFNYAC